MTLDPAMTVKHSVTFPTVYSTGSTVDVESASGQKVVSVTATTNFTAGDRVILDRGNAGEEEAIIDSVQAGVSITLLTNLVNTQAVAVVVEVAEAFLSEVIKKSHYRDMALFLPAGWTTAAITFAGCDTEDGTFLQIVNADDVGETTIASIAASKCISLNGEIKEVMATVPFIKLRSGTLAAPVDQGKDDIEVRYVLTR